MHSIAWTLALTAVLSAAHPGRTGASPLTESLRARGSDEMYNLDDLKAIGTWREATVADPEEPDNWRGLASAIFAHMGMLRGTMTVDSYLGRVATKDVGLPQPPADLAGEFDRAITRAISLSREKVSAHPRDPEAQYELGAAIGIQASYLATIQGGVMSALRSAREAFDVHERVLQLAPERADAGLVVGTYRYLVSTMSLPMRLAAYLVGFGGGRERGIQFVEGAAAYPGDNQSEARLALLLLYSREGRHDDALKQLSWLRDRYPRNRLLWLETGSALIRANRPADAERYLNEGFVMLANDTRPRMLGEEALWYYRRGAARAALGRNADAQRDLERSLALDGRQWVQGRAHFELGRLALRRADPVGAREHLQLASSLGDSDRDGLSAARARALMKQLPKVP
jgi:tetratricopeptide (TPR) repeat protein